MLLILSNRDTTEVWVGVSSSLFTFFSSFWPRLNYRKACFDHYGRIPISRCWPGTMSRDEVQRRGGGERIASGRTEKRVDIPPNGVSRILYEFLSWWGRERVPEYRRLVHLPFLPFIFSLFGDRKRKRERERERESPCTLYGVGSGVSGLSRASKLPT